MADGGTGWVMSGCELLKDSVHTECLQRLLASTYCKGKRQALGNVGRWIPFSFWKISSSRGQEQLVQVSWICWYDRDGEHLFCLQSWHLLWTLRDGSLLHLPRGLPGLCGEVADPALLCNLAITVTIWGSALKHEGGWDTSDLCGNSGRVAEFRDQQWQTGRLAF